MQGNNLTEKQYWDDYWNRLQLPAEISWSDKNLLLKEELKVFEKLKESSTFVPKPDKNDKNFFDRMKNFFE